MPVAVRAESREPRAESAETDVEDGPVVFDPKASAARIMEELRRDPEAVKAASKSADLEAFVRKVRGDLHHYFETSGVPQNDVAKGLGCSATYVNQFLHDKFPAKREEPAFAKKVSRYLSREGRRAERVLEAEFVETRPCTHVLAMLQQAHDNHQQVLIVARSGIGKTSACRYYEETNEGVIYILAGVHIRAPRSFLRHLARRLNLSYHGHLAQLYDNVVEKLKDSGRLLIVDEAEFLTGELGEHTLEMLRQLRESTAIGLAFVSNEVFWRRLKSDRTAEQLEKFTTRLAALKFLRRKTTRKDVEAIISRHLDRYDDEVVDRLLTRSQLPGAFRSVALYCQQAAEIASRNGGTVTCETLDAVAALVEGELEDAQ